MIFYNHFVGDYLRDTKDLSLLEHGAYRLLLDHYYAQRGDMPEDVQRLYRACNASTAAERRAVQAIADRFFPVNGDGRRHNKRADEEIAKSSEFETDAEERRKNERERQSRHRERRKQLFEALRKVGKIPPFDASTQELERMLSALQIRAGNGDVTRDADVSVTRDATAITSTTTSITSKASDASHRKSATASRPIPDCPQEKLIDLYHELLPTCTRVEKWTPARQAVMRARWRDEAKPNREKHRGYETVEEGLAYWRRFFAWCSESKFLTGGAPGREGGAPFVASLPWLLKAENFAKAIEGNYHR